MPWLCTGLLAVLALGAAGCALVLAGGLPRGPALARTRAAGGAALVRVLPAGDRVLSGPQLSEVNGLAGGMGGIWLTGGTAAHSHLLYAVNPATSRISAVVALPSSLVINPGDVAAGAGAVWVADGASLYRIVPGLTGQTVTRPFATLPDGGLIGDVVTAAGSVWVDDTTDGTVDRYAATSGRPSGGWSPWPHGHRAYDRPQPPHVGRGSPNARTRWQPPPRSSGWPSSAGQQSCTPRPPDRPPAPSAGCSGYAASLSARAGGRGRHPGRPWRRR